MSKQRGAKMDLIRELRLRHWARVNYVPLDQRRETWHPIVLEEMRRRDAELNRMSAGVPMGLGYVPLQPTDIRVLHEAHDSYPDPKLLRTARPSDVHADARRDLA